MPRSSMLYSISFIVSSCGKRTYPAELNSQLILVLKLVSKDNQEKINPLLRNKNLEQKNAKFAIQSNLCFYVFHKLLRNFHFMKRKLFSIRKVSQIDKQ